VIIDSVTSLHPMYSISYRIVSYHGVGPSLFTVRYARGRHQTVNEPKVDASRCAEKQTLYFYRAMLCIRGTSHGPVSVSVSVCHKSEFY